MEYTYKMELFNGVVNAATFVKAGSNSNQFLMGAGSINTLDVDIRGLSKLYVGIKYTNG